MAPPADDQLSSLLGYIRSQRGIDFSSYKEASLQRRITRRMQTIGRASVAEYLDYLQASPSELDALLQLLFINVTKFFRDPAAWEAVRSQALEPLVAARSPQEPIRVWCAGVASGEEAYTVAMLLCEQLGAQGFRERVKVFATDLDDDALTEARQRGYTESQLNAVPEPMRAVYFERHGDQFQFRTDLRRCVIFGRHDLLEDAPISRLDLLVCRNTLMYFNRDAQTRILNRFHFALRDDGFLFLGKAEMLLTRRQLFTPVDQKARLFVKSPVPVAREHLMRTRRDAGVSSEAGQEDRLRDFAFNASPAAQIVVDAAGRLALANDAACAQLGLARRDVGRPLSELEVSYRPLELRSLIEKVEADRRLLVVEGVERSTPEHGTRVLDVRLMPLLDDGGGFAAVAITFTDVTKPHRLRLQLEDSRVELERAYEELQSTNEELETTNEELQSTVEELETTNEELQSTNEELETMNEELQSTNDEVRAVNEQLQERSVEIDRLAGYLRSVVDGVGIGVVVLDGDTRVQMWNEGSTELWGLREDEVRSAPFLALDIGLPVDELRGALRSCQSGDGASAPVVLRAHDRRGRRFECRVSCVPLSTPGGAKDGMILLMEPWPKMDGAGMGVEAEPREAT